jgi:transcription elongation factor GreA
MSTAESGLPGDAVFALGVSGSKETSRLSFRPTQSTELRCTSRPVRLGVEGMSTDRIPMSKEGYDKLKAQLDQMKNEDMPRVAEQIATARDFGDLSENAEFDAAVEAQGMLQARINELADKLGRAMIVDKSTLPTDRVVFGSRVRVLDLDLNDEEDFILVGPGEEDYDQNKILLTSPIGQGLVGKKLGDEVNVPIPRGTLKLRILGISFD